MNWYVDVLKKYAEFSGRARRTEYWMFVLVSFGVSVVLSIADALLGTSPFIAALYSLAVFIPNLAVAIRRLHDTNRSGWWLLIGLIPFAGAIVLLVFMASEGEPQDNAHGANPKQGLAY
ncbi:DUF805 domain-containing protein [Streptomyces sp. H27-D2]|uniref:DUF805 domain-containing protein n=1 Tax=Streptomyces sp. H27-D2 TaxID=3046304 RepID=UPI002DBB8EA1|nr:DUF805 domain-containing protein [Streptomyces sp. H27-D2]MEC4019938.1 DUF805 domain-containing protein [Streptomyces sp. H27-D2]